MNPHHPTPTGDSWAGGRKSKFFAVKGFANFKTALGNGGMNFFKGEGFTHFSAYAVGADGVPMASFLSEGAGVMTPVTQAFEVRFFKDVTTLYKQIPLPVTNPQALLDYSKAGSNCLVSTLGALKAGGVLNGVAQGMTALHGLMQSMHLGRDVGENLANPCNP